MNLSRVSWLALISATLSLTASAANTGFEWKSMVLYQPEEDLHPRMPAVKVFAAYCKRLDKVCTGFFAGTNTPEALDIVVGLKPGKKVRVWFVSSKRSSRDKSLEVLRKRLEAVAPCEVRNGAIVFAMRGSIAGAKITEWRHGQFALPMPQEWLDAVKKMKNPGPIPDGIFPAVWPD